MELEDLDQLADDPNLIEGIHNYCDRWCERCPFTARCINFKMGRAFEIEQADHRAEKRDLANTHFWSSLHETFQTTLRLLQRMADEMGVPLDSSPEAKAQSERRFKQRQKLAESHPLAVLSREYIGRVDRWFQVAGELFTAKAEQLHSLVRTNLRSAAEAEAAARELHEMVDVIRWYQHFIHVKLMRAIDGKLDAEELNEEELNAEELNDEELDDQAQALSKDADGTAKVVLIAIERSLAAWNRMLRLFPTGETETLEILVRLARMRRAIDEEFPAARSFVRPGFDEISLLED